MAEDTQLGILIKSVADLAGFKQAEAAAGSMTAKMESVGKNMQRIGGSITSVGKTMSVALTAPIVGLGVLAVKEFGEFDEAVRRAGAFVEATEEQMNSLRDTAISAAKGTKFSFQETADAIGDFIGGGITAEQVAQDMGDVVNLALVAGFDNLKDSVNLSELALTTFKDDGISVQDVMDRMAGFAADVDSNTQAMSIALVDSAGAARSAGFSFDDLLFTLSAFRKAGLTDIATFGTAFNSAVSMMQKGSKQTVEALDGVGLSMDGLKLSIQGGPIEMLKFLKVGYEEAQKAGEGYAFLSRVVGDEAVKKFAPAMSLTNDELAELAKNLQDTAGKGQTLADKMRDATPPLARLNQLYHEFNLAIAPLLVPIFEKIVGILTRMVDWFKKLSPETQDLIVKAALIVAAMGPVLVVIGGLISAIGSAISIIAFFGGASVVGAFIGSIAGIGIIIGTVAAVWVLHWQKIKAGFETVYSYIIAGINNLKTAIFDIKKAISETFGMGEESTIVSQAMGGMKLLKLILPGFDTGGIVPGPIGSPQMIIAHGGETVLPTHKSGTAGGWTGDQNVNVTINVTETVGLQKVADFLDNYLGQKAVTRQLGIS